MIKRIAQRIGNGRCPGQILLIRSGVARDVFFFDAVGAHCPPFVMITLEPDLEKTREAPVLSNVLRTKMAVVVEDWLRRCKPMVKASPRIVRQKKIFGEEASHGKCLRGARSR